MSGVVLDGQVQTFVSCNVDNEALIHYLWRYDTEKPKFGHMKFIHAPSHWDDLAFAPKDENAEGEDAFYDALNKAYEQFHVHWVCFIARYPKPNDAT